MNNGTFVPTHIAALGNSQDTPRIRRQCIILRNADVPGMKLVQYVDGAKGILPIGSLTEIPKNEPKPTIVDGTAP